MKIVSTILFAALTFCVGGFVASAQTTHKRTRQMEHTRMNESVDRNESLGTTAVESSRSERETGVTSQVSSVPKVSFFEKAKVDAGFAKGIVLFDESGKYQVHASRREKPGVVEIHEKDADIMYFVSGTATLVTGGEPVNTSTVGPGEIRATDIKGGETRHVRSGDVIVIPAGTPHWFKEVPGPLTYFTVKAR